MKTLIEFFEDSVEQYNSNIYLWEKPNDKYEGTTYGETRKQVYEFAAGLLRMGISKGDRISLLSEGRSAWVISELGVLYAGAINVPLSVKLNPEEIKFRLIHSESKSIIVSAGQLWKIKKIINGCPAIERIIVFDAQDEYGENEIHFNEVKKNGREWLESGDNQKEFEALYNSINYDDYANICYTSGTTADPKGILLSHGNYVTNVYQIGRAHV